MGGICPHGAGQTGALCTQAQMNPLYGQDGMRLLAEGRSASEIVAMLTAADPGKAVRQLHLIDRDGRTAAYRGQLVSTGAGALPTTWSRSPGTCWPGRR